jgi:cellulose synthase/poly-beta-1,6-N-acetylglucosamine synthase-like glycosyltransferase
MIQSTHDFAEFAPPAWSDLLCGKSYKFNALFVFVLCTWLVSLAGVWVFTDLLVWGSGLLYVAYDTVLLAFVAWSTRDLRPDPPQTLLHATSAPLSIGVVVAARNERLMLPQTLRRALSQLEKNDTVWVIDDGSTDGMLEALQLEFGLRAEGDYFHAKQLYVLPIPNGGKARALNLALQRMHSDIVVTLDADTQMADGALSALREAFAHNRHLVAACGIVRPRCGVGLAARFFEMFQRFEYLRAFLSRAAWMRSNALLLVSGAFAGYRLGALRQVGGFRVDSRVEDYELIHRLHRHGNDHQLNWQIKVVPTAYAETDAPANLQNFLVQRKRWFSGFLQTLHANRDMVGNAGYGVLGRFLLPIKVIDTLQPVFGVTAFVLLVDYLLNWHPVAPWILLVIVAKLIIDISFHMWSVYVYHRWLGRSVSARTWLLAIGTSLLEPFSFQLLRHCGALLGWTSFLTSRTDWIPQRQHTEVS